MLIFCDFIQVFVFTTNHHFKPNNGISLYLLENHLIRMDDASQPKCFFSDVF